ncbi:hypothetical protein [Helicobacter sp. 11S02596-1]|uniref:hypothetical protein n=1 Tax=Helicobacter sp. 11S02596-1 TaxID=1476194 RepID=UPI000BA519AD|nr:hypothetical protein [Helicobacter sp. 11S02596-1]PAF41743.1 hypothetical protein BJI48_07755 [Helicobacter sp. 11S02596-1]
MHPAPNRNQNALAQKELNWFDTIKQSQQNQMEAQTDYTKANTILQHLQAQEQEKTMPGRIQATNATNQAQTAQGNRTVVAWNEIGKDKERMGYYKDSLVGKPKPQKDPLHIRNSSQFTRDLGDLNKNVDGFFMNVQNYNKGQFGPLDSPLRGLFTLFNVPTTEMKDANNWKMFIKANLDTILNRTGHSNATERKQLMDMVDGITEGSVENAIRNISNLSTRYYQLKVEDGIAAGYFRPEQYALYEKRLSEYIAKNNYIQYQWKGGDLKFPDNLNRPNPQGGNTTSATNFNGVTNYKPINPNPSATSNKPAPRPYPSNSAVGITKPTLINFYHE